MKQIFAGLIQHDAHVSMKHFYKYLKRMSSMTFCDSTPITPNPTEACTTQTGFGETWLGATVVLLGMRNVEGTGAAETSLCVKANCHLKRSLKRLGGGKCSEQEAKQSSSPSVPEVRVSPSVRFIRLPCAHTHWEWC